MREAQRIERVRARLQEPRIVVRCAVCLLCVMSIRAQESPSAAPDAASLLHARYEEISTRLSESPLGPALYMESAERSRSVEVDSYSIVEYSFDVVREALSSPNAWCEALLLHLNIKYCKAGVREERALLFVAIGRKFDQPLSETSLIEFTFDVPAANSGYLSASLNAKKGPFGTKAYRVALEAIPLEGAHSFVHVRYSYTDGVLSRLAMRNYLKGAGKHKVGFTRIDDGSAATPQFIGGSRGVVERNMMRYFLAIDALLAVRASSSESRFEKSAERWFAATERYALQLHEMDHDEYMAMKRAEFERQRRASN